MYNTENSKCFVYNIPFLASNDFEERKNYHSNESLILFNQVEKHNGTNICDTTSKKEKVPSRLLEPSGNIFSMYGNNVKIIIIAFMCFLDCLLVLTILLYVSYR